MGTPNTAQLHYIEVMCESILQGMYCVLVIVILWLLMRPKPMPMIHRVMFLAGILMWALSCVHLGLVIQQVTHVVTPIPNAQAQASIATIQFMIGDMIIIWRVWVVWGRSYLAAAIPFLLMLSSAGVRFAEAAELTTFAHRPRIADVATALLVTNVILSTILIAGRIWYMQWKMNKLLGRAPSTRSQNKYQGVLLLIIESGAIYALSQIIDLILDDVHSNGIHTVLDLQIPLAGILPTLIVLVVHLDLVPGSTVSETQRSTTVGSKFQAASRPTNTSSGFGASKGTSVSLRMETINDSVDYSENTQYDKSSYQSSNYKTANAV
ncbi:hypothetical protein JR316_0004187 [Psilocybe cubensis]|uniref:Uncharacterized protein n=2 Tax=Psilocybe cubensis TaxID=181762 RepID=A0ACB8H317_PSICU|nr:hypothetical protein JR316_0004187 [Psilocybe cubensis]KAH9482092.1 hypothetical protein JR316_0004187 [Psilocybe cubensis]